MNQFGTNVLSYEESTGMDRKALADKAHMTMDQVEAICKNNIPNTLTFKFCSNLGIDPETLYSETGFVHIKDKFERFISCPDELRKSVTVLFFNWLAARVGTKEDLKRILIEANFDSRMKITRLVSGTSKLDYTDIGSLANALSKYVSQSDFESKLLAVMYGAIPNYNIKRILREFGIKIADFAAAIYVPEYLVAGWTRIRCVPIPDKYMESICTVLGVNMYDLVTRVLSYKEVSKCMPTAILRSANKPSNSDLVCNLKQPDRQLELKSEPKKVPVKTSEPKCEPARPVNTEANTGSFVITDDRIEKMYKSLSLEAQQKVKQLVFDLFIGTIQ